MCASSARFTTRTFRSRESFSCTGHLVAEITAQKSFYILAFHTTCAFRLRILVCAGHETTDWMEDLELALYLAILNGRHFNEDKNFLQRMDAVLMAYGATCVLVPFFEVLAAFEAGTAVVKYTCPDEYPSGAAWAAAALHLLITPRVVGGSLSVLFRGCPIA